MLIELIQQLSCYSILYVLRTSTTRYYEWCHWEM